MKMRNRRFINPILKQRGATLIEAIVAAAILGSVVVMVAQYHATTPVHQNLTYANSCQNQAQAILGLIQEETYYRELVNFAPASAITVTPDANRVASAFDSPAVGDRAVTGPGVWWQLSPKYYDISEAPTPMPALPPAHSGTSPSSCPECAKGATLQNFQLINGSIRTLESLYNANIGTHCTFTNVYPTGLASIALPPELSTPDVDAQVYIQLQPYSLDKGLPLCSTYDGVTKPLNIMPQEMAPGVTSSSAFASGSAALLVPAADESYMRTSPAATPPAMDGTWKAANSGNGDSNVGIEMSVRITYKQNGSPEACNASQKFEYPRDRSPPDPPNLVQVFTNNSVPVTSGNDCKANVTTATLKVGYQGASQMERGAVFLCHDLSWLRGWAKPVGSTYNVPPCIDDLSGSLNIDPDKQPTTADPTLQDFSQRQQTWVPCDQLTQCGIAPTASNSQPKLNTAGNNVITLTYNNLPLGCNLNFEAMTVDSAGNSSVATNRQFLYALNAANSEMLQNTCGTFCDPGSAALSQYYSYYTGSPKVPNGYYTCRGGSPHSCCVGAGCTPLTP